MENNQNQIEQQSSDNNSRSLPVQILTNKKTKITTKIFITLLFYIALYCISVLFLYIFYFQNNFELHRLADVKQTVFFIGIAGVIPLLGGSDTLFLFPFAPLVGSLLVIFVIVSILEKWKIITGHKKIFLTLFTLSIVLFGGLEIFNTTKQTQSTKQITDDRNYYEKTYETQKPVESKSLFIYPEKNEIIVSDIYGNNKQKIYSYSEENIGYISPNGKYFVNYKSHERYLLSADNSLQETDLCVMKDFNNIKVCPIFCNWDPSGSSFVCKYKFREFFDKNKRNNSPIKNVFVLFNPRNGKHKIINQIGEGDLTRRYTQDFALIDSDTMIFIDKGKFYKAENLYDCQAKISEIKNISDCDNFIFENNNIYCSVDAKEKDIEIKDRDNFWVDENDYFIIKQSLEQSSKEDYVVINKAPMLKAEMLFNVDDKFIFIVPIAWSIKILDIETGLSRDFLALDKEIESDKKLIFKKERSQTDIEKIPKVYIGNSYILKNLDIQECEVSEEQ